MSHAAIQRPMETKMILNRRIVLAASAAAVPLMAAPQLLTAAVAAPSPDFSGVRTIHDFAAQVIGRADLSRAASEVAVQKAARADAAEFATYELMEAKIVIDQLKALGTAVPRMGPDAEAALHGIVDAARAAPSTAPICAPNTRTTPSCAILRRPISSRPTRPPRT